MPAYLYQKLNESGETKYLMKKKIPIAGYNVIHHYWIERSRPLNKGWEITADEVIRYVTKNDGNIMNYSIVIDSAPSLKDIIDLKEVHDIHLYTYKNEKENKADWSVLCLRVHDIYYQKNVSEVDINCNKNEFQPDKQKNGLIYSFLYLHGDRRSWNWGRLGQMNGAWIYPEARQYFLKIMNK
ncbi:MAG: hypothetical protein JW925_14065 [Syntrophaceae bacterium]|nr:hypothetical protein [Syntrophaceae bacterium]